MSMEVTPYMAQGERYPSLIGVEADGDEHELAYVSKHELIKALEERDRLQSENAKLREENERLKLFAKGDSIITDYWKDDDGTMHVLATDGSSTFEYMRGGLADENAKLRELVTELLPIVCDECSEMLCKTPIEEHLSVTCLFHDKAVELGIEVEG